MWAGWRAGAPRAGWRAGALLAGWQAGTLRALGLALPGGAASAGPATGLDRPYPPLRGESATRERVELGRALFFDPVLSRDGDLSCAHCHRPDRGLADGLPRARGRDGHALPAADHVVRIRGMRYPPKHLQVKRGETVRWVNEDAVPHTVTSGVGVEILRDPLDSPFLLRGDEFQHTFASPGRFEYLCLPHMEQAPMREATITVGE